MSIIRRNKATAEWIQKILRLPDERWSGIRVTFGHDGDAIASVDLIITADQLAQLAHLVEDI